MADGHVPEQQQQPPVSRQASAAWKWAWVPGLGLLKGRRALKDIRWTGAGGRDLARRAIAVNAVVTAAAVAAVIAMPYIWSNGPQGTDPQDLSAGQCFDRTGRHSLTSDFLTSERVKVVSCAHPHDGETVGVWDAGSEWTSYPDSDELRSRVSEHCGRLTFAYAMDAWLIPDTGRLHYFAPTQAGWVRSGNHTIVCSVQMSTGRTSGSLHGDPDSFTAQQRAYLTAENGYTLADSGRPDDESATADVPPWTDYAAAMATATLTEEQALRGRTWSASAAAPVAALESDLHRVAALWIKAAAAGEGVTIDGCVTQADAVPIRADEVAVRRAMGLAVEPADALHLTTVV